MTEWQDAKSSMISGFRFVDEKTVDGVSFGTLEILWKNGSMGAYLEVNRRTYEDFLAAESRGKFLNQQLKPNFRYEKRPQEATGDAEGQNQAKTQPTPPDAT